MGLACVITLTLYQPMMHICIMRFSVSWCHIQQCAWEIGTAWAERVERWVGHPNSINSMAVSGLGPLVGTGLSVKRPRKQFLNLYSLWIPMLKAELSELTGKLKYALSGFGTWRVQTAWLCLGLACHTISGPPKSGPRTVHSRMSPPWDHPRCCKQPLVGAR